MLARLMMSLLTWAFVQAPLGANDPVEATARDKHVSHWAFQRPVPVAVPQPVHAAWLRTPVDALVLDRLEKAGLGPASVADRAMRSALSACLRKNLVSFTIVSLGREAPPA